MADNTSDKSSSKSSEKADTGVTETTVTQKRPRRRPAMSIGTVRTAVAQIVWLVCLVFALVLAVAVLLIAIKANANNNLVNFDVHFADHVDLGVFDLSNPIKTFGNGKDHSSMVQTALFNYGIGAVVWLVIGRLAESLIRPKTLKKK